MENQQERDELLFEQLKRIKRRKRRRILLTVLILLILAGVGITAAVITLRSRVRTQFAATTAEVLSYQASQGRISTTVSGSGTLSYPEYEDVSVPAGVELTELLPAAGDRISSGSPVATVDRNSVLTALAELQATIEELDDQINDAKNDTASTSVTTSVSGRVKRIYVQSGDSVIDVMTEHGALAVLSLDGLMSVTIDAEAEMGSSVTVLTGGKHYTGTVETSVSGRSTIVLTDNGPADGEEAEIQDSSGNTLDIGTLEIHKPLSITGYAGTVGWVSVTENQQIYSGGYLFTLQNTRYTGTYDTLLRERAQAEKTMGELIGLLQSGCVTAPFDGIVTAVTDLKASSDTVLTAESDRVIAATMAPDGEVCISVAVDETDILSLELGQSAQITISSIGEDVYPGTVTEISRVGTSSSGVTQYSAVVTLTRTSAMLSGMTASVDIQIQGTDDVVLIPVEALHQTRNTAYVFTGYDETLKEYTGMVEVVVGASNSKYVEIVSGLSPGDTVYYTEKAANANPFQMMPMGGNLGGNMGGNMGGSFPGGSRPSGGGGNRADGSITRPGMGG